MSRPGPARLERIGQLALLGLLAWLFAPSLAWLVRTWQAHPYYSHGPLLPLLAGLLVWRRREALRAGSPSDLGLPLVAAGLLLHLAALRWEAHPVSALALLLLLAGLALLVGGRPALRAAAFPILIAALAIPLPWVERLAPPLAAGAARATASAALLLGIPVVRMGAQLGVADGAFVVGAPCSGLNSLVALLSLAVIVAGLSPIAWSRRLSLVLLAAPLALAANGARLLGLLWAAETFGAERGLALFHGPASPAAFALATLGLLGLASVLGRVDVRV